MNQSELQPAATIAMVEQGATARPICHTKRRVIFPTFDSKTHNNKVTTANSGNGHPAEIAVPNQALELPATGHVECPKKVSTCPLLLPLLGGPPHPASCANTSPRGMPCLLEPQSTKPSVVSSHRAGSMLRGPSVVRPDPARRSVLFVSTAETERIPSLPFPPSKIIQNISPTDTEDPSLPTGASHGRREESTLGSAETTFQCGVSSSEVSDSSSCRPLLAAPFFGMNRLATNLSTPSHKSGRLPSILRTSRFLRSPYIESIELVSKICSIESDTPSLASSNLSPGNSCNLSPLGMKCTQVAKLQDPETSKSISFDPRVWVREFRRTQAEIDATWFTIDEMEGFKTEAMQRIIMMERQFCKQLIPTGTSRMVQLVSKPTRNPPFCCPKRALFSHKALCVDADCSPDLPVHRNRPPTTVIPPVRGTTEIDVQKRRIFRCAVAENEIRHVLLVDSSDVCRGLFARGLQKVLPHATVVGASNTQEAFNLIHLRSSENKGRRGFDVVIVDERLKSSDKRQESGSVFLRRICEVTRKSTSKTLLIGVSADLRSDAYKLQDSGADLLWQKPPPRMDQQLRDGMLKALLVKRGRNAVAGSLFD